MLQYFIILAAVSVIGVPVAAWRLYRFHMFPQWNQHLAGAPAPGAKRR